MWSGCPRTGDAAPYAKVRARCSRTGLAQDLKRTYANGTLRVPGTHHGIFSLGFASQNLVYRLINEVQYAKG